MEKTMESRPFANEDDPAIFIEMADETQLVTMPF